VGLRRWVQRLLGKSIVDDAKAGYYGWSVFGTGDAAKATGTWETLSTKDQEALTRKVSLVYSCVQYIVTSLTEAPLVLVREDAEPGTLEPVEDHEAAALIEQPNSYYSQRALLAFITTRLLLTGEYYIWKWRARLGVRELWPVPSSWVTVKTGKGNELISHYVLHQGRSGGKVIQPADMVRQWMPHPGCTWRAFGPLHAIERDVQTEQRRMTLLAELLQNLNVPGAVITSDRQLTPHEKNDIRAALVSRLGEGGRGRHLILAGGARVDVLNPLRDIDTEGLMWATEPRICGAFGVPPILVGARIGIERSTYANYQEARRSFYRETMRPLWAMLAEGLTKGLLHDEGETGVKFMFDLRGVAELQGDAQKEAERAARLFQSGVITRNEARAIAGLPELDAEDGDVFCLPATVIERPAGEGEL